jgi:hypothetical protein
LQHLQSLKSASWNAGRNRHISSDVDASSHQPLLSQEEVAYRVNKLGDSFVSIKAQVLESDFFRCAARYPFLRMGAAARHAIRTTEALHEPVVMSQASIRRNFRGLLSNMQRDDDQYNTADVQTGSDLLLGEHA